MYGLTEADLDLQGRARQRAGELVGWEENAEAHGGELPAGVDDGRDAKVWHAQAPMVKLYCSEMVNRVADWAVQIFGGRGYGRENVAERCFRELRVERVREGKSEIQRGIIAQPLARRGPAALI